jgi:hypothetical protein
VPDPQERRLRDRVLPIFSALASLPDSPIDPDRNLPNSPVDAGSPVAAPSQRLAGGADARSEGTGHGRSIRQPQDLSVAQEEARAAEKGGPRSTEALEVETGS